jgi:methylthioribose-1-phosphate isomerase
MRVHGKHYRTIWPSPDGDGVEIIDQTRLPFAFSVRRLRSVEDVAMAIRVMQVRGAPLIGAAAAYGLALALSDDPSDANLESACRGLAATRPTAVNLRWALDDLCHAVQPLAPDARAAAAWVRAAAICDEDAAQCRAIGEHGLALLRACLDRKRGNGPLNVLTHCNAGWLATVDYGTALAPIYLAHEAGVAVHVWVDETRPRNQGASLTAWELGEHGVPHTIIADNTGGHLMQQGEVDACIVGTDRTASNGDVCNKIGTYLKALAAHDNGVPFYVAVPHSSIDWSLEAGVGVIPIEERDPAEVHDMTGRAPDGHLATVRVTPPNSSAKNFAFDVTPARLVTSLITERGSCSASRAGLLSLYPERGGDAEVGRQRETRGGGQGGG